MHKRTNKQKKQTVAAADHAPSHSRGAQAQAAQQGCKQAKPCGAQPRVEPPGAREGDDDLPSTSPAVDGGFVEERPATLGVLMLSVSQTACRRTLPVAIQAIGGYPMPLRSHWSILPTKLTDPAR